jgi:predicted nuclease of predicted toxin-antitoxin system
MMDKKLLKFYVDTNVSKAVSDQLRDKGIDIVRCEEFGKATDDDPDHLEFAVAQGRVMVSHDEDFLGWHKH